MAVHNDPRLYSGGAVVFDSQRSTNLYAQLMARQQAKRDALDQYYQKTIMDTTPKGMRNKDVLGGWSQKLNEFQQFAMNPENRRRLLNPGEDHYKALTEFNQRHAELMADAEKSKQELADEKMLNDLRVKGLWNPTDDDIEIASKKGLSIYDKNRQDQYGNDVDLTNISFNIPNLTPAQLSQYQKTVEQGFKRGKNPAGEGVVNKQTGRIDTPFNDSFKKDEINIMAERIIPMVQADKKLKKYYNNILHSPDQRHFNELSKAYQSYDPDGEMDTPEKVAVAETILIKSQPTNERIESVVDPEVRLRHQKIMEAIRFGNRHFLAQEQRQYKVMDQKAQDAFVQDIYDDMTDNPQNIPQDFINKYKVTNSKGHKEDFDEVRISPDGETVEMIINYGDGTSKTVTAAASALKQSIRKMFETQQTSTGVVRGVQMNPNEKKPTNKKKLNW